MKSLVPLAVLVPCLCGATASAAGDDADSNWLADKTKVTTGWMLPPVRIPTDPRDRALTSISVEIDELTIEGGTGVIVFDTSVIDFDEFGDGAIVEPIPVERTRVELVGVDLADKGPEGRRLFEIRFPDEALANALYLVLSPGPITRDRLLIVSNQVSPPSKAAAEGGFHSVIPLEAPGARQWCPPTQRTDSLSLHSFQFNVRKEDGSPGRVSIEVTADKEGRISLAQNPNLVYYTQYGDVELSTSLGYFPLLFKAEELPVTDPTGRNRRVLRLAPMKAAAGRVGPQHDPRRNYSLVVAPERECSDRLLIYERKKLTRILPLVDVTRQRFLTQIALLSSSSDEGDVLRDTRSLVGDHIFHHVQDGHVTEVTLYPDGVRSEVFERLADLPELRVLTIADVHEEISVDQLQPLSKLQQIDRLTFYISRVTDGMLEPVQRLKNLKSLRIYDELPHGDDPASLPHVTDDGVKRLLSLQRLEQLSLYGPGITDEGLAHVSGFANLIHLYLHRTRVTVAALAEFARQNPDVRCRMQKVKRAGGELQSLECRIDLLKGTVTLSGDLVSDDRLAEVCTLTEIKSLRLGSASSVTDAGLQTLSQLQRLESLAVQHNRQITAEGLRTLTRLAELDELSLWSCRKIDDDAVQYLVQMKALRKLDVGGTQITSDGLARLREALPDCQMDN